MSKHVQWSVLVVVVSLPLFGKQPDTTIHALYHHKGHPLHKDVELGKVVLYCSQTPAIKPHTARKKDTLNEWKLVVPHASAVQQVCDVVCEQRTQSGLLYRVAVCNTLSDTKKNPTAQLIIDYDAQQVLPEYALFDSVSQQKGLVIRFYNKNVLDCIQKCEQPVLSVAAAKTPPLVVIDTGHGGEDTGAIGCNALREKEITLALGQDVAHLLGKQGIKTVLTRDADVFLPLDVRTTYANACDAALFVSIHANASANPQACGIETYCLSPTLFFDVHEAQPHEYAHITRAMLMNLCKQSNALAHSVHSHLIQAVHATGTLPVDRKVKQAVSQVLLGASMPSVLVEVGFLSNVQEAQCLACPAYRQALARGMCAGIVAFL